MNLWTALRSKDAAHALLMMLLVNSEISEGRRYGDYDEEDFSVSPSADRGNYLIAWLVMAQSERLYDHQRFDEGVAALESLPLNRLPGYYRSAVLADYLYYYTVLRPDEVRARELYAQKKLRNYLHLRLPGMTRTLAACAFFLDDNHDEGWNLLKRARVETAAFPNRGVAAAEQERLDDLERRFRSSMFGG
jgi:hypothetical protein